MRCVAVLIASVIVDGATSRSEHSRSARGALERRTTGLASKERGLSLESVEPRAARAAPQAYHSRAPRYAKVNGVIETLWQPPHGSDVRGLLFMAHGCMHQATDFFYGRQDKDDKTLDCSTSNFGSCLALPEERQLVEEARKRGLYVMAVSGGTGKQSCWNLNEDPARVKQAIDHVIEHEGLDANVPVFATGASSGGAFMAPLAMALRQRLKCVVPQISALAPSPSIEAFAELRIPTLFVHMPERDPGTAEAVEADMSALRQKEVRVQSIPVGPYKVIDELHAHYTADQAERIAGAFKSGDLLTDGMLTSNPRESDWRNLDGLTSMKSELADSFVADESKLAELLNAVWAQHEFTAKYAKQMLDFCDGETPPGGAR